MLALGVRIKYDNVVTEGSFVPTELAFVKALFADVSELSMYYIDIEFSKLKKEYREIAGYIACFDGEEEEFVYGAQKLFMSFKSDILGAFELMIRQEPYEEKSYHYPEFVNWRKAGQVEIDPEIPF